MGFSLTFEKIKNGEDVADIDRNLLVNFLKNKKLTLSEDGLLQDENGQFLKFDGDVTDLHLTPLDSDEPLFGGIDHATLSDEELQFIFEMCDAVGWLIINPQGNPTFIIPNENHSPEDLPEEFEDVAFIKNVAELRQVLSGGFENFQAYLKQIRERL